MELTVQNVYGLLLRSKLLSFDEARGMFDRWHEESKDGATNLGRFAQWMVANRYVTEYQAGLLVRGHADGFFLNDYKVLDRLGKGRMAGVYRAQHQLGQIVAIKVLPPSKAQDPHLFSRFKREAQIALKLKHPNIVRAFQVGQAPQTSGDLVHYLVMEQLEGETLEDVLHRRGHLPPAEASRLIHQALQGLQHIHAHGLVHRDLKPANMMLVAGTPSREDSTLRSTLKILDMGLGRSLFEIGPADSQMNEGLTGEGVLLGTPDYMSPEQARDARSTDIRGDIYSLGCVLYHLLSGQLPFPDTNIISQMIKHATEEAPPLNSINPAVPDGLQQIVSWMMAKDPAKHYPTPERAAQALQMFLAAGGGETLAAPEADPSMRSYLTWLASNEPVGESATPPPRPNQPAATVAVPAKPPTSREANKPVLREMKGKSDHTPRPAPRVEEARSRPKQRARKGKSDMVVPAAPPPLPQEEGPAEVAPIEGPPSEVDVELVSLPGAEDERRSPFDTRVDRRDFVVFALGVAAGGLAVGIGCLLALRGRPRPALPETEGSSEEK